jgi:glycosidase
VIYSIYPSIFSPTHSFNAIAEQMARLKKLGVNVIWLMPVTPIGHPIGGHPALDSPYCVHDFFAVNPDYGTASDLRRLVSTAHHLGMKVILDEVLNHTAWDNALITQHPEYFVHSDGNSHNPASIKIAFNYNDVAQLNYGNSDLRAYMVRMLRFWITAYNIDGFRFDSANNPDGPNRMIPADFWQNLAAQLRTTRPNVLLLGECETPDLALKPFSLDYGWRMYDALKRASTGGDVSQVKDTWIFQTNNYPKGMLHMSIQDDWDDPRDVNTLGGSSGAHAAAVFNFTIDGIPLIYNGMEIGNSAEAVNPHAAINWLAGNTKFTKFYTAIISLRARNTALQQRGELKWVTNSVPNQVLSYERSGAGSEFLILDNLSNSSTKGTLDSSVGAGWSKVALPYSANTALSPSFSLGPKGFAVFKRTIAKD